MKQTLLIALLYFSPLLWRGAGGEVSAQQRQLDSLLKELKQNDEQDEKHLKILNALSEIYAWMQLDSGIIAADKAIALAQKLNNQKELATAYNNKVRIITIKDNNPSAEVLLQKALTINTKIKNNIGIADNYVSMAILKSFKSEGDSAIAILKKAFALYFQKDEKNGLANVNFWTGWILMSKQDSSCLDKFHNAIKLFEQTGNVTGIAYSYDGLGCFYSNSGNFDKAMEWFNKAVLINKQNNIVLDLTQDYANISSVYLYRTEYPKSLDYMLKALRLSEQTGSLIQQAFCLNAIASLYFNLNNFPLALEYAKRAIVMYEQIGQLSALPSIYNLTGNIYSKMKDPDKAIEYLNNAMELAMKYKDETAQSGCYRSLGRFYLDYKKYDLAIPNSRQAMVLNNKLYGKSEAAADLLDLGKCIIQASDAVLIKEGINPVKRNAIAIDYFQRAENETYDRGVKRDASFELSLIYEKQGDSKRSYENYKLYVVFKDSIMNTDNSNSISNMQIQYESEKQEQQIASLTKDKALHQTEIEKQKTTRNAFIGGLVLMLLLAGVTYNRYRMKQKANIKIENTLTHLKNTQEQLVQQGKLAALGKMTAEVAVEIQTPLQTVKQQSDTCEQLVEQFSNSKNETEQNHILDKLESILETINQNGKMADGIVKNVLMQSRR